MKFDLTDMPEQQTGFEPLPDGWYPVVVEDGEWRRSKSNGQNEYLNLKLRVKGDNYANRVLFHMLNLINTNETATNIAKHDLKNMFLAMGSTLDKLKSIEKDRIVEFLSDKPFKVKLKTKIDKEFGDKNVIKDFDSIEVKAAPKMTADEIDAIPF